MRVTKYLNLRTGDTEAGLVYIVGSRTIRTGK